GLLEALHPGRADRQPGAEVEPGQVRQQAGLAGLIELVVELGTGPPTGLLETLHAPLQVEAPCGRVLLECDARDRDSDLRAPSVLVAAGLGLPDGVPIAADLLAPGGNQAVEAGPGGIDGEYVSGTPVPERVEHDGEVVFLREIRVPGLRERHDLRGL